MDISYLISGSNQNLPEYVVPVLPDMFSPTSSFAIECSNQLTTATGDSTSLCITFYFMPLQVDGALLVADSIGYVEMHVMEALYTKIDGVTRSQLTNSSHEQPAILTIKATDKPEQYVAIAAQWFDETWQATLQAAENAAAEEFVTWETITDALDAKAGIGEGY